jgi:tetratricopeptide (TPR) repeat protein
MVRIRAHDADSAVKDLNSADQLAPKHADIRLWIADLYIDADQPAVAVAQFNQWIDAHGDDGRLSEALNGRCWARALSGRELDLALKNCNAALRLRPKSGAILDSRGLVYLRMGKPDKAIDDYGVSLQQSPNDAWSRYGRGIARLHKGLTSEGQADIEAANSAEPSLVERARRLGIVP